MTTPEQQLEARAEALDASYRPAPAANPNRLLLLGALGGALAVLLLVVAVWVGYQLGRSSQQSVAAAAQVSAVPTPTATPTATQQAVLPPVTVEPAATAKSDPALTAALPTDPALAAEEIDLHSEQQQQLIAQKQSLNQQVSDSNQLIELKTEQIRLLEAELAKQP